MCRGRRCEGEEKSKHMHSVWLFCYYDLWLYGILQMLDLDRHSLLQADLKISHTQTQGHTCTHTFTHTHTHIHTHTHTHTHMHTHAHRHPHNPPVPPGSPLQVSSLARLTFHTSPSVSPTTHAPPFFISHTPPLPPTLYLSLITDR